MNYGSQPGWYSILDELHIFIWWQCHRRHKGQSLLNSMNPGTEEKLITINIHDGGLMQCVCDVCMHAVLHSCRVNTINVYMCVCVCVSIEDLLGSKAGMLILHGLSKWADRSHYSHHRMRRAVVPSAWIHMSGQTDLSFALSVPKKTMTLNSDMYSTFMRTRACSLSEGSVEHTEKTLWRVAFYCWASTIILYCQCWSHFMTTRVSIVAIFVDIFRPSILRLKIVWHLKDYHCVEKHFITWPAWN